MKPTELAMKLEQARADAWLRRDKEALRHHLHDDYLEINIFGRFTKQQVLDDLFESHQLIEYKMADYKSLSLGASSFAVSYRVKERLKSEGQVVSFECFVVAVYQEAADKWLLRLWQITPISV